MRTRSNTYKQPDAWKKSFGGAVWGTEAAQQRMSGTCFTPNIPCGVDDLIGCRTLSKLLYSRDARDAVRSSGLESHDVHMLEVFGSMERGVL